MLVRRIVITVYSRREKPIEEQVSEALFNAPSNSTIEIAGANVMFFSLSLSESDDCPHQHQHLTETFAAKLERPIKIEVKSRKYDFHVMVQLEGFDGSGSFCTLQFEQPPLGRKPFT